MALMDLPAEILELSLSYLFPADVTSFGRTCKQANAFVHPDNKILWRSVFLHLYDDPEIAWKKLVPTARIQNHSREIAWDWHNELRKRANAFDAVYQPANVIIRPDPEEVVTTLLDILQTSSSAVRFPSQNLTFLIDLFATAPNAETFVHDYHRDFESVSLPRSVRHDYSERPVTRAAMAPRIPTPEWACRFHIYYGMTARERNSPTSKRSARELVYSWLGTDESAEHGPFLKDQSGEVNWQTLEAIMSLMQRIFDIARQPNLYRMPSGFENSAPLCLPPNISTPGDWAGVERAWVGTYAFLDYRSLVHYNFSQNMQQPTDLGHHEEACGDLMTLNLRISDDEELRHDQRLQTALPYCSDLSFLRFIGTSNNGPNGRLPISVKGFAW